jgi:hypothetical protein
VRRNIVLRPVRAVSPEQFAHPAPSFDSSRSSFWTLGINPGASWRCRKAAEVRRNGDFGCTAHSTVANTDRGLRKHSPRRDRVMDSFRKPRFLSVIGNFGTASGTGPPGTANLRKLVAVLALNSVQSSYESSSLGMRRRTGFHACRRATAGATRLTISPGC